MQSDDVFEHESDDDEVLYDYARTCDWPASDDEIGDAELAQAAEEYETAATAG